MGMRLVETEYGRPALDEVTAAVAAAKTDDPMTPVTILVPGNLAGIVLRRHLAAHLPAGGVAGIEVTTLRRLAERLAAHRLTPRRPATRPLVAAAWRQALAEAPGLFAQSAAHPATVAAVTDAHRELRELTDAALERVAASGPLAADLVRLHLDVTVRLACAWYDEVDLLREAAQCQPRVHHVLLHLPQELRASELALVQALAGDDELLVVAAATGVRRADRRVEESLDRLGLQRTVSVRPVVASRVLNASDSDDEVRALLRDLLATLEFTPAHRIAILYSRAEPYARLLHEQLTAAGITVNGPGTRPIVERGLPRALLEILALVDLPRAALFTALGDAPASDFEGQPVPLATWERISREAGVVAGDDWTIRLDAYVADLAEQRARESAGAEPRDWLLDRLGRRLDQVGALRRFALRLREELVHGAGLTSWRELADWCAGLYGSLFGAAQPAWLPPEEQYAAAALVGVIGSLATLDAVEPRTSLPAFVETLQGELDGTPPRVGRFGEGVLVAPLLAAEGLDLDVVYVVGLSEDQCPGRFHIDPLLGEDAREASAGELASPRDRLDAEHRHLLAALAAAPHAVASFPRGDLRHSTRRLPSRFLLPSLRDLVGDKDLAATAWEDADFDERVTTSGSYAGALLTTAHLAGEQEWRIRAVRAYGSLDDPVYAAAQELLDARAGRAFTRFDGNLTGSTDLPDLLAGEQIVSPTALEAYADCPHRYFVERLLKVAPVESPEDVVVISPADIGTFVHEVMDELIHECGEDLPSYGRPWSDAQRDRMHKIATRKADLFERTGRTGHDRLWRRELERILADLDWMLSDDDRWRADLGAKVLASEMPFGMKGYPPVAVEVPDGRILMRGSADLVDKSADGALQVTDIKTGSRRSFMDIKQDQPTVHGTKLQLPVYAIAARDRYGAPDTPVRTDYWFVRRDRGRIGLDLTPEVLDSFGTALTVLARSIRAGLFPARAPAEDDYGYVRCPYCNPDGLGYADRRRQWEAKAGDPALAEYLALVDPEGAP